MANAFLTDDIISLEALSILENELVFGKYVSRTKEGLFGTHGGSNRGATVRVRRPNMYTIRSGANFTAQDVQDLYVPFTISTQIGVDVALTSAEMAQSLSDFSAQVIKPAVSKIANEIDSAIAAAAYQNTGNSVGTPGTAATALSTYLSAGVRLDQNACPRGGERYMITGPQGQADIVDALKGLVEAGPKLAGQYAEGEMKRAAGFNWDMDQNVRLHTSGARGGTPLVNGAPANGATTIVTDAWTASAANRLKAGDVFTAGVYMVNPVSKVSTGVLKQFTSTGDVASDGAGNATITVQEAIYYTGAYQNVSAQIADNVALTFLSAASTDSGQAIGGHKSAITLGFCELPKPDGVDLASTKTDKQLGLSIRFIRWYDGSADQFKARFDVLYGVKVLRPEWLVRVHGAAA